MRALFLLCCGAAASAAVTEPRVLLKLSPLIGGPKLLRVHSQLFVDSGAGIDGWDFVPKDATAPATLARLLTLRAAPGDARRLVANDGVGMYDVGAAAAASSDAIDAALAERPTDLHLISNNCWSHTIDAAAAALGTDRGGAVRALVGAVLRRRPWRPVARPPIERDSVAEALAAEKSKRYGTSLAGLFSEEDRARAGASIKAALADEAEPPG
ncbi:unnamed protein product [Pelagomonas calceolata]|uniref:Uncharacterized protein n=1 Tax=Pelagomonas calceolata TaxID=35677 RepID=A0A7S3ZKV3_9STRA|nr:unnamed protein product [Pelagomonas calceolata]|mmetsp:Transcript_17364/g.53999  ORF Transcript_17364/g.53999 Transcript_17364/m.53999 type:complete len:213 (+) Transcript_17364:155-793(+)